MTYPEKLVKLYLTSPFNVEPMPDKALLGRLDKVLRNVGAGEQIAVRSRMITAVASTKYKTKSGHPVSLVGLHGKDELLVVGPTWAIERLATGEQPNEQDVQPPESEILSKLIEILESEIFWLLQVPRLVKLLSKQELNSDQNTQLYESAESINSELIPSGDWDRIMQMVSATQLNLKLNSEIAEKLLCMLLRATTQQIIDFFASESESEYALSQCNEACRALAQVKNRLHEGSDNHPVWWSSWLKNKKPNTPLMSEQDLTVISMVYSIRSAAASTKPRQRKESIHSRWLALTES